MCGICGKVNTLRPLPEDTEGILGRMCELLKHRGPDDEGHAQFSHAAIGHRRLSIIDLSGGHQPIFNEDDTMCVVCNGEVYNFHELRAELEARGHSFHTNSDTEVVIHLYEDMGPECVKRLRGMFALAIWDDTRRRLVLAVDRLGQKPLVYAERDGSVVFASELRSILVDQSVDTSILAESLEDFFRFGYVPWPNTIFRDVKKLPPAHLLVAEDGRVRVERYWQLRFDRIVPRSEGEAVEELLELLREAVKLRLISDVPLGAFLSGGLDSSIIVALMSEASSGPVETFSIGFEESDYDERAHARRIAERYGTTHHEFVVRPDMAAILPEIVWHYGEPYADASAVPTFFLSRLTRQHVTVALNGDGGDELFAGYPRYALSLGRRPEYRSAALALPLAVARVPGAAKAINGVAQGVLGLIPSRRGSIAKVRDGFRYLAMTPLQCHWRHIAHVQHGEPRELLAADVIAQLDHRDPCDVYAAKCGLPAEGLDPLNQLLTADLLTYLPDDLLVKVDIAAMSQALEPRSPFLDHKVAEFAASLSPDLKLRNGAAKYLLRKAAADLVPTENLNRRKQGFAMPVGHWLRHDLKDLAHDVLLSPTARRRGLLNIEEVSRLLQEHVSGTRRHDERLWELLMLELWFQRCVDAGAAQSR